MVPALPGQDYRLIYLMQSIYNLDDTIAAVSTPMGQGGIGIVRMSGPGALMIADRIFFSPKGERPGTARSHSLLYGHAINPSDGSMIDEVLVSVMRAPRSYTRENVVEFNCHGGAAPVQALLELLLAQGARLAEPGEFTKRAFLNGRISLAQAEAVMDLISARTEESLRIAAEQLKGGLSERLASIRESLVELCAFAEAYIDFPEEEIGTKTSEQMREELLEIRGRLEKLSETFREARFFREGLAVAIAGKPNVGKSSLLNTLLKKDRAIVTECPGTTRDLIEDYLDIKGLPVSIVDTAGIRNTAETVEKEGVRRSIDAMERADFIIAVFDGSRPAEEEDFEMMERIKGKNGVIAVNKSDLPGKLSLENMDAGGRQYIHISALTGQGIEELKCAVFNSAMGERRLESEGAVVSNIRHKLALDRACTAIEKASDILAGSQPLEIVSIELREAMDSIGEITGAVTTEEILNRIFSDFCIGK
jgi:tRNA modification GTPase